MQNLGLEEVFKNTLFSHVLSNFISKMDRYTCAPIVSMKLEDISIQELT